jgi:4'-phosphopantetheinyl transferase
VEPEPGGAPSRARLSAWAARYAEAVGLPPPGLPVPDSRGKPRFPGSLIHASVAHSGELWACALHTQPVGLDIERHTAGRRTAAIARRFFTSAEQRFLRENPDAFYPLWCAKEAFVKSTGAGLAALADDVVADETGLFAALGGARRYDVPLPPGYSGCLWAAPAEIILRGASC